MRKLLLLSGVLAIGAACGATASIAQTPNVPPWSPYATMGHSSGAPMVKGRRMIEGRSAYPGHERYTLHNPEGPLNDYYRGSGLSDRADDCASYGCAGGSRGN